MKTSTKTSVLRFAPPSFPMPLWMQGALELFLAAFFSFLTVFLLLLAVWFAGGFDNRDMLGVLALTGQIWQLIHGVPLHLDIPTHGTFAAISGTISLIPLGLTLIPLALCFRSGRRLAQASYEGQFWVPTLAGSLTYALLSCGVSLVSSTEIVFTSSLLAALVPLWVVLLGLIAGGWYESRSLARMIGVNAAAWVSKFSQYSRWTGSYIWTVFRSSFLAALALVGLGGLLFALAVFYNWNDVLALYQSLHAGAVGDTAITLLQAGFIPNFVVWAMAWSVGAGFSFGQGTLANLTETSLGALPSLPILGAIPVAQAPFSYLVLSLPLLAGTVAGWWFFRAGENHLDEWISLKIRFRWISWPLSTLCLAVFIGLLSGLWMLLIGWAAYGSLGLGRFTSIGPNPLLFGALAACWIGLGVILGSILAPIFEKDNSGELERFADQSRENKRRKKQELKAARKAERQQTKQAKKAQQKQKATTLPALAEATEKQETEIEPDASAPVIALNKILADSSAEENLAEPETQADLLADVAEETPRLRLVEETETSAENTAENTSENSQLPWQEKSKKTPKKDRENKPKLSLGRVIRRPKSVEKELGED